MSNDEIDYISGKLSELDFILTSAMRSTDKEDLSIAISICLDSLGELSKYIEQADGSFIGGKYGTKSDGLRSCQLKGAES